MEQGKREAKGTDSVAKTAPDGVEEIGQLTEKKPLAKDKKRTSNGHRQDRKSTPGKTLGAVRKHSSQPQNRPHAWQNTPPVRKQKAASARKIGRRQRAMRQGSRQKSRADLAGWRYFKRGGWR